MKKSDDEFYRLAAERAGNGMAKAIERSREKAMQRNDRARERRRRSTYAYSHSEHGKRHIHEYYEEHKKDIAERVRDRLNNPAIRAKYNVYQREWQRAHYAENAPLRIAREKENNDLEKPYAFRFGEPFTAEEDRLIADGGFPKGRTSRSVRGRRHKLLAMGMELKPMRDTFETVYGISIKEKEKKECSRVL